MTFADLAALSALLLNIVTAAVWVPIFITSKIDTLRKERETQSASMREELAEEIDKARGRTAEVEKDLRRDLATRTAELMRREEWNGHLLTIQGSLQRMDAAQSETRRRMDTMIDMMAQIRSGMPSRRESEV